MNFSLEIGDMQAYGRAAANLGVIYKDLAQYEKAEKYHKIQMRVSEDINDKNGLSMACANLGIVYMLKDYNSRAENVFKRYLKINEGEADKRGIGLAHLNLGTLYTKLEKLILAEKYLNLSSSNFAKLNERFFLTKSYCAICDLLIIKADRKKSGKYLLKARQILEKAMKITEELDNLLLLAGCSLRSSKIKYAVLKTGKLNNSEFSETINSAIEDANKSIELFEKFARFRDIKEAKELLRKLRLLQN